MRKNFERLGLTRLARYSCDMARKIPAMPIDSLASHPLAIGMNGAAFGHLMRLALHFWLTECKPLPVVDNQLYVLARAYPATWKANRDEIKAVLQDVCPILTQALRRHRERSSILDNLRQRGIATKKRKILEKTIVAPTSIGTAYEPKIHERNRSKEIVAPVNVGAGFVDKLR